MMSLAMWPEQPLRSSGSSGSGTAFMPSMAASRRITFPLDWSMRVQKQVRPEVSAAPSISTPFLPPSLKALATTFSARPEARAASFLGNSCASTKELVRRGQIERRARDEEGAQSRPSATPVELAAVREFVPRDEARGSVTRGSDAHLGGDGGVSLDFGVVGHGLS